MKRKWVWVTRDEDDGGEEFCVIWDGPTKPTLNGKTWDRSIRLRLTLVCAKFLFKYTGIKLKPGECKRVEFSGKIVEKRTCSKCDREQNGYHNMRKCRKCGGELVSDNRHELRGKHSLQHENKALRAEVNALRVRLGIGVKYREWEGGPET